MPPHEVRDLSIRFLRKHCAPASSVCRIIELAIGDAEYYGMINGQAPFIIDDGGEIIRGFLNAIEQKKKLKLSDIEWTMFLLKFTEKNQYKFLTKGATK